jgi:hypothetical protein
MKRMFSHIIIFLLLMISPVSFSTTKIPNFYILVTVNAPLQESRKSSIAVVRRAVQSPEYCIAAFHPSDHITLFPALPAIDRCCEIEHGRAPPVVPSA